MWYRDNKISRLLASILIFVLISLECMADLAYAAPLFDATNITSEQNYVDTDIASPSDAIKEDIDGDTNKKSDVILDEDIGNIEIDEEDINRTEKIYTYGIQNTGIREGILGTRLILTCTGILMDEIEVYVSIDEDEYVLVDAYEEPFELLEDESENDEKYKYTYYFPVHELNSAEKAGYKIKLVFNPSEDYKVSGLFSARMVGDLGEEYSENIFSESVRDYSNTLHSNGQYEDGNNGLFSVRFRTDGGELIETQKVLIGECAIEPDAPLKTGYTFKYWEYNGEEYDFSRPVTQHITLKAVWEPILIPVIFEADNGEESIIQEVQYGKKIPKLNNPVRSGYRFNGWYRENGEKWLFGTDVVTEDYIVNDCITLRAGWEDVTYWIVEFKDTIDKDLVYATYRIEDNLHVNRIPIPRKTGYIFTKWTIAGEDDIVWDPALAVTSDITLVANWVKQEKSYTVKFDLNGGYSDTIETQVVGEGGYAEEPETPTLEGYRFDGWYIGKEKYDFTQPVTKNIKLKARWGGSYTISFDLDGGQGDFPDIVVESGETITTPEEVPIREGYKFKGWYFNDNRYVFSEPVYSNIKLVAKWMDIESFEGRYAVSIYGIYQDKDISGRILGLTFGPALVSKKVPYVSHIPEEDGAMCIHDMSWKEIIEQSKKDATVFQECLEHGCTKSVEFELKGTLAYPYQTITYPDGTDGDGYIGLIENYNKFTINNQNITRAYAGSITRTILVGRTGYTNRKATGKYVLRRDASLAYMLPGELSDHIVPRKFNYWNDTKFKVTKSLSDKIWLFSWSELYNTLFYNGTDNKGIRQYGEGETYEKIDRYAITTNNGVSAISLLNNTNISTPNTWLRTPYRYLSSSANINIAAANTTASIAPGFCLAGPSKADTKYRIWFNPNTDDPTLTGAEALETLLVNYNNKVSSVVDSLPKIYRGNDYELIGWYTADTSKELRFGKNITKYNVENRLTLNTRITKSMNVYARWGRPGYLKSISLLKSTVNSQALHFKQSKKLTSKYPITDISQMSDESLYTWYDPEDRTQYWWSSSGKMIVSDDASNAFSDRQNWQTIDLTNITYPTVKSMYRMFYNCTNLKEVIFDSKTETLNVTNMEEMFKNCSNLEKLDMGGVTAAKVTTFVRMFESCGKIKRINLGNFATSSATNVNAMFNGCSSLEYLDMSKFDTHKVTNTQYMYLNCSKLKEIVYGDNFVDSGLNSWGVQDLMCGIISYYAPGSFHSGDGQDNPTYQMYYNCPANRPHMWSEGRWIEPTPNWDPYFYYKGTYIKGHPVYVSFANASMVNYPINTVPNFIVNWGHKVGEHNLPDLGVYEIDGLQYKFIGWNEEPSGYYKVRYFGDATYKDEHVGYKNEFFVTKDTEFRYVKSGIEDYEPYGDKNRTVDWSGLRHLIPNPNSSSCGHSTTIVLYPRWSCEGLAKDGNIINGYINSAAVQFKQSLVEPTGTYTDISYTDDRSVRTWYDSSTQTQYWWSSTGTMKLYSNAYNMFNGKSKLVTIDLRNIDFSRCVSMESMFYNCSALKTVLVDEKLDTSKVTNMATMFYNCSSLQTISMKYFDTEHVTKMNSMFQNSTSLKDVDINMLDTHSVTTMQSMFQNCRSMVGINLTLDASSVTTMQSMFQDCAMLQGVEINNMSTNSVTTMESMFNNCVALKAVNFTFDTSSVINMRYMFNNCTSLKDVELNSLNTSKVTNMEYMFYNCTGLEDITLSTNTSVLNTMSHMFMNCTNLKYININELNLNAVTTMDYMFANCSKLVDVTMSSVSTVLLTNAIYMFNNCSSLESLNMTNFDTHKVTIMRHMFDGCTKLKEIVYGDNFVDDSLVSLNYLSTNDNYNGTNYMFRNCPANKPYKFEVGRWTKSNDNPPGTYIKNHKVRLYYNQSDPHNVAGITLPKMYEVTWGYPIGEAAVPTLTDPSSEVVFDGWNEERQVYSLGKSVTADTIFNYTGGQGGYTRLSINNTYTDIYLYSKWTCDGMSKIGSKVNAKLNKNALYFRQSETEPDRSKYTVYDISLCDDESVLTWYDSVNQTQYWWSKTGSMKIYKDASNMFSGLSMRDIELKNIDFSIVTNMSYLFNGDTLLETIKFDENIDTSNVLNMSYMFSRCNKLNSVHLELLDTSNVTNMSYMFYLATTPNISNFDFTNFDTSKVTTMHSMFESCSGITSLDLSSFDTSKVTTMRYMFYNCVKLIDITYSEKFVTDSLVDLNKYLNYEPVKYEEWHSTNGTFRMFLGCPANRPANWTVGRWFGSKMYLEHYKIKITYAQAKNKVISGITLPAPIEIDWGYPIGEENLPEMEDPKAEAKFAGWNEEKEGYTLNKELTGDTLLNFMENVNNTRYHGLGADSAYMTIYMRWTSEGVAKQGNLINQRINANAQYFRQSEERPAAGVTVYDISLSDDKSVLTWYDATERTQYWWSSVGTMMITSSAATMFNGKSNLIAIDLTHIDFSIVSSFENFCKGCSNLQTIIFDNTKEAPKVTNLHSMFEGCSKLIDVDLTSINSKEITTFNHMFSSCTNLVSVDMSSITSQKINDVYAMFDGCTKLTNTKFNNIMDTPGITNTTYMFRNCRSLAEIDLSWMNTSKVQQTRYMFENCINLKDVVYSDKFVDNSLQDTRRMDTHNGTLGMYSNCPANKPYMWTVGRWTDIDNAQMHGAYIKGHVLYLNYYGNLPTGVTISGLPSQLTTNWGYELGDSLLPKLVCSDDRIQFVGWDVNNSGYVEEDKHLTNKSTLRYTTGVDFGHYASVISTDTNDFTRLYIYAKWRANGLAKIGTGISSAINNSAVRFKQSFEKPESMIGVTDISFCNDRTLLTWYDSNDNTQYWWGIDAKFIANNNSAGMFANKPNLKEIDLTNIEFSRTTTLASAFVGDKGLESLDLTVCDFSSLTDLESAFASSGLKAVDMSNLTFPVLANLSSAFAGSSVATINMESANFPVVTNLTSTFANCTSLESVNLSNADFSKVTELTSTFSGCTSLKEAIFTNTKFSNATSLKNTFENCKSLILIDFTDTDFSSVTLLSATFSGCSALVELDISVFDYSQITSLHNLLVNCTSLETVVYNNTINTEYTNLQFFDTKNPTYRMYYNCTANTPETWISGRWDDNGTYINNLYFTVTLEITHDKFTNVEDVGNGDDPDGEFKSEYEHEHEYKYDIEGLPDRITIPIKWGYTLGRRELVNLVDILGKYDFDGWYWIEEGYGDIQKIQMDEEVITSNVTLYARFRREGWMMPGDFFSGELQEYYGELPYTTFKHSEEAPGEGVVVHDVSECEDGSIWMWGEGDTVYWYTDYDKARISDAALMFSGLEYMTTIDLTNLDFSETKDMQSMFSDSRVLTIINFGDIDTSNVEDMSYLFDRCVGLETIDVGQLNTSRVSDMSRMFGDCIALTEILNLNTLDTSNVDSMRGVFSGCEALGTNNNGRLEVKWNTSNVTDMQEMFDNCIGLKSLTITSFDTSKVRNFRSMFYGDTKLNYIYYGENFVPDSGIYFENMLMDVSGVRVYPSATTWPGTWEDDGTYKNY